MMLVTKEDFMKIVEIAKRSEKLGINDKRDRQSTIMDLKQIDLDYSQLLNFDDYNFSHDLVGIYNNFNRQTFEMDNCFSPRSEKKPKKYTN